MEYIITNVTKEEIEILEREGIEWYPDTIDSNDVVIDGDEAYYKIALNTIGRN